MTATKTTVSQKNCSKREDTRRILHIQTYQLLWTIKNLWITDLHPDQHKDLIL